MTKGAHMIRRKMTVGLVAMLAGVMVITGCSSEEVSRSASAEETPVPEVQSGEVFEEPVVGASGSDDSVIGVRFCTINQSSRQANVDLRGVGSGEIASRNLGRGDEVCTTGSALIGRDITGSISVDGLGSVMDIEASRPSLWLSWVRLTQPEFGKCSHVSYFQNGGSSREDGVLKYSVKRLKDTDVTNFQLTLLDPRTPSKDGAVVTCYE
jgi:hypothetical protein